MSKESNEILNKLRLTYCNDDEIALEKIKDDKLRKQQLTTLKENILNKKNLTQFDVYDFEPAWGKTTEVKKLLLEYKRKNINKRILWVTERKEDCKDIEKEINTMFDNEKIAKAIVGGIPPEKREEILDEYDIVIITHERYRRLARYYNLEERKKYQKNRHLLVIDEQLNMTKTVSFSLGKNALLRNKIYKILGEKGAADYDSVSKELLDMIKQQNKYTVQNKGLVFETKMSLKEIKLKLDKVSNLINLLIKENDEYKYFDYDEIDKQTIKEQVEDIMEFYTDTSIIAEYINNEVVLQVPNNSMEMWTLEYNIILDATASIDKIYSFDKEKFNIIHQERIYNHKFWKFLWVNVNSTTYGRNNVYENYNEVIANIMKKFLNTSNTLIVGKKKDETEIVSNIAKKYDVILKMIGHYGNLNGSNEFENCKNFMNIDLDYINDSAYVLKYLYYSKNKIEHWKSNKGHFVNKELDDFKTAEIVKTHCQAIKRINRKMIYHSIIIFLCHREDIMSKVYNYFEGIDFKHCKELEKLFKKKKLDKVEHFKQLCLQICEGEIPQEIKEILKQEKFRQYTNCLNTLKIPKIIFAEAIGCKSKNEKRKSNSFGTNVLKDKRVQVLFEEQNIIDNHTTINFPKVKK